MASQLSLSAPSILPQTSPSESPDAAACFSGEIFVEIFSRLSLGQLMNRCALVCKKWERMTADPIFWSDNAIRGLFKEFKINIFNERDWEANADLKALGLDVSDVEPLSNFEAFKAVGRYFAGLKEKKLHIKEDKGLTILTVPKNLSLGSLVQWGAHPKRGNPVRFRELWELFFDTHAKDRVAQTYRIIISNGVLASSDYSADLFHKLIRKNMVLKLPRTLEHMALLIATFAKSNGGVCLFPRGEFTYCQEKIDGVRVVSGGFYRQKFTVTDHDEDGHRHHCAGVLRLESIPRVSHEKSMDPFDHLPDELLLKIFPRFPLKRLANSNALVCKRWERVASDPVLWNWRDLNSIFNEFRVVVFSKKKWNAYADLKSLGLDLSDLQPLTPYDAFKDVGRFFAHLKAEGTHVEGDAGVTILTLPKNLSLNALMNFAQHPKTGNPMQFKNLDQEILDDLRKQTLPRSYRVIVTNNILTGTRSMVFDKKMKFMEKTGLQLPTTLEAVAVAVTMFVRSGSFRIRLFADRPFTYTYCQEKIEHDRMLVGGFDSQGLDVDTQADEDKEIEHMGTAAAWRL